MKKCFIISPIGKEGSETRKRADQLFKHIISPACKECNFDIVRVDQINQADQINQTIIEHLTTSQLVIADLTDHNPNVFYEIGYRWATNLPIIHIKAKNENIPFDIAGIRAFDYDLSDLDSVEEIKNRLIQTIKSYKFQEIDHTKKSDINQEKPNSKNEISQILPILYEILDNISQLKTEISNKDTNTISSIIKAVQSNIPTEAPEITLMKTLLPEIIKNPDSINTIMKLTELAKK